MILIVIQIVWPCSAWKEISAMWMTAGHFIFKRQENHKENEVHKEFIHLSSTTVSYGFQIQVYNSTNTCIESFRFQSFFSTYIVSLDFLKRLLKSREENCLSPYLINEQISWINFLKLPQQINA